eukprot:3038354-Prymnesium_polylepis.1
MPQVDTRGLARLRAAGERTCRKYRVCPGSSPCSWVTYTRGHEIVPCLCRVPDVRVPRPVGP